MKNIYIRKANAHEFDGARYAEASGHQTAWGADLIRTLPLRGGENILDLGCGDGRTTRRLAASAGPEAAVLGIDASRGMIAQAAAQETDGCRFEHLDMEEMSFDSDFDLVFSNAALHWILDQPALARRIFRALKPGGLFAAEFAAAGNCANFLDAARSVMGDEPFRGAFRDFIWPWNMPSAADFAEDLRQAGFTDIDVREVTRPQPFPDEAALAAWIDQPCIVPFLEHLPPDLRQPFRDRAVDRTVRSTRQPDGTCLETFCRLQVQARRPA